MNKKRIDRMITTYAKIMIVGSLVLWGLMLLVISPVIGSIWLVGTLSLYYFRKRIFYIIKGVIVGSNRNNRETEGNSGI